MSSQPGESPDADNKAPNKAPKKAKTGPEDDGGVETMHTPHEAKEEALERAGLAGKQDGSQDPEPDNRAPQLLDVADEEPQLLDVADEGISGMFPGVPCVTVAKRCKRGKLDPSPKYLNRFGPRAKGWFVWSSELHLAKFENEEDLQNVSEPQERVLDYPRRKDAARVTTSHLEGLENLVWDSPGFEYDPLLAAELLNPNSVKSATKFRTLKERKKAVASGEILSKYPILHANVRYRASVNQLANGDRKDIKTCWEVGSHYRALYGKDPVAAERRLYEAAKKQARNFLNWYKIALPEEYKTQNFTEDPSMDSDKQTDQEENPPNRIGTTPNRTGTTPNRTGTTPNRTGTTHKPANVSKSGTDQAGSDDSELTEEEIKEAVMEGWLAKRGIPNMEAMTPADATRWNLFWTSYSK